MKPLLPILALALLASGCTLTRFHHPETGTFTRVSFGTTQTIGPITVTTKEGTTVKVDGYSSEQAQLAGAAVEAAVRAATGR